MKKALTIALAALCFAAFADGEYVARGIGRKTVLLDGGTNAVDAVVVLRADRTVAPYAVQVISATKGNAEAVVTGVTTNFTVVDRVDSPSFGYVYTNGAATVTNVFKRADPYLVNSYRPSGFNLKEEYTNHVYTVTTNVVGAVAYPDSHYSVTTNTVSNTVTNYTPSAASGTISVFGVEEAYGTFSTNVYLNAASLSGGKLAVTNCYNASTPLFAGDRLHVKASQADKVTVKIIYLTYGED